MTFTLRVSKMRIRAIGFMTAMAALALAPQTASACQKCRQNPCVLVAPRPAYQCVTELVPHTEMQTRTRVEFREITRPVMRRVPQTTWTECQRVVCRMVFDTTMTQRQIVVCKPVYDTTYINETFTVCRPVQSIRQVTDYCMQPTTKYVSVVARNKCGVCGHAKPACGCQTVALTYYTPVPIVRDVVETRMVPEVQTRQVPVTHCRLVREVKVVDVPHVTCRQVQEVVTDRIPHTTWTCVPDQITCRIPYPVCETVPVTTYRPVTRMVPCAPAAYPAPQAAPSGQASGQA